MDFKSDEFIRYSLDYVVRRWLANHILGWKDCSEVQEHSSLQRYFRRSIHKTYHNARGDKFRSIDLNRKARY